MSEKSIVRMSAEEARRRREAGESRTDWERFRGLTDEEIEDAVRSDPDAPPLLDEEWFERAEWVVPGETVLGELRTLLALLGEREKAAQAQGMRELATGLSGDRARLSEVVERLSGRQRQEPEDRTSAMRRDEKRTASRSARKNEASTHSLEPQRSRMSDRKVYHVTPHEKGWQVKGEGASRASSVHKTKKKAVSAGRSLAKKPSEGQIKIHKRDGTIETEHTYKNDPTSSPG